ncbi:MAG: UTP--glucose-1-phosphate uridylyltransferase GalU [Bacillota bacterium]
MKVRKAVIPAAGLGTRFLPATKAMPKEMLPIVDKPIIQYVVEEAVASGIEDILIITGRGKRAIEDHFDRSIELEHHLSNSSHDSILEEVRSISELVNVHFVRQKVALGLGHAVLQARQHVGNEPFAVLLGDEIFTGKKPCLKELIDVRESAGGGSVIAVRPVPMEQVSRYGVIAGENKGNGLHRVAQMVEKPAPEAAPSNLAVVGRYIIDPQIFEILDKTLPGRGGEIQLTDALNELAQTQVVFGYETQAARYDVGNKLGYIQATLEFALARPDLEESLTAYLKELLARAG